DLLADDRVDEHAEGITQRPGTAPGFGVDGFCRVDEARELSIARLQRRQGSVATRGSRSRGDRPIVWRLRGATAKLIGHDSPARRTAQAGLELPNARSPAVSELDLHRCRRRTTPQGGRIVRTKSIILGAIAALALVTLSANAGNRATPQAQGTLVSLLAATTTVAKADREAEATAAPAATHTEATEAVAKPVVAARPAPKVVVSAACQVAINNLKALHQADVTED